MPDQDPAGTGTTRRWMLRGAAGVGAAGIAAGVFAGVSASHPGAATAESINDDAQVTTHDKPVVVYVHDASTGVIDLYTGEQHVRFTDHQLAARFARAAR